MVASCPQDHVYQTGIRGLCLGGITTNWGSATANSAEVNRRQREGTFAEHTEQRGRLMGAGGPVQRSGPAPVLCPRLRGARLSSGWSLGRPEAWPHWVRPVCVAPGARRPGSSVWAVPAGAGDVHAGPAAVPQGERGQVEAAVPAGGRRHPPDAGQAAGASSPTPARTSRGASRGAACSGSLPAGAFYQRYA